MANREALRELQSRLASRLQAARSEGPQAAWLAVECAGSRYLLPLAQAGEIFPFVAPQPVPYTQPWFLGVANLRGALWGVADLAGFLGQRAVAARPESVRAQARLVALNGVLEVNCALLVDRITGLAGLDTFSTSSSAAQDAPPYHGSRYADGAGVTWQELNLQLLSQEPRFLGVGA